MGFCGRNHVALLQEPGGSVSERQKPWGNDAENRVFFVGTTGSVARTAGFVAGIKGPCSGTMMVLWHEPMGLCCGNHMTL